MPSILSRDWAGSEVISFTFSEAKLASSSSDGAPAAGDSDLSKELEAVTKERDELKERLQEYEIIEDDSLVHTKKWLELGQSAKTSAILSLGANAPKEQLLRLTEKLSITKQIENILSYPNVKKRFENGDLHIHGWYYDIETGSIDYYNPETYEFLPLKDLV